ncbi:MAG TPA: glycosyltransferase family 4 protein [Actinomycetes bacterium]|nr:glycosyltransferase family 4 protein [Actinomycetes bacterium]
MRVLMLSWEYPPVVYGGLGRHVHALAEAMADADHQITVITQRSGTEPLRETVAGVDLVRVPQDPPYVPLDDIVAWTVGFNHALARTALRLAAEVRPDVVHAHDWLAAHAGATLRDALRIPLVATLHATEAGRHQGWLRNPVSKAIHSVEWWLTYQARRVITCSSYMRAEVSTLFGLPEGKLDVIPNGIDLERWRVDLAAASALRKRYAPNGPLVVYTGRLEWEKGLHTLVRALPGLRQVHPGLRLVIAGRGSREAELRALARSCRVSRAVTFTGWLEQEELAALAAAADCAIVPSIYEPFGIATLEAAASGTPLVVADTGGLREIVEHGVTGLRFEAGDVAGLAAAVDSVLSDEVLAHRLVRDARAVLATAYRWTTIAERTVAVYRKAVEQDAAVRAELRTLDEPVLPQPLVVGDENLFA